MKKRFAALFLALLLAVCLLPPRADAAGDIYFTAVNDNVLPLNAGTMPAWVDGVLYVPYTVFDSASSGVNLRISWNQNRTNGTFTLYTLNDTLVFDLNQNNSKNAHSDELFYYHAITRNGKIYVPIAFVCSFFGLGLSRISTPYGELVRIKNSSVVLSDRDFTDAAASLMETRLRRYNQSLTPADPDPSAQPSTPPDPDNSSHTRQRVYLAVECTNANQLDSILSTLERTRYTVLFLVSPDRLNDLAPQLRRAAARGHTIGFLLSGEGEDPVKAMNDANDALFRIACVRTSLFSMENGEDSALTELGYVSFRPTVRANVSASRVMRRVEGQKGVVRLLFSGSGESASRFSQVLRELQQKSYTIRPAVEPEF